MAKQWLYPHAQERQLDKVMQAYARQVMADVDAVLVANIGYFMSQAKLDAESSEDPEEQESWSEELALLVAILLARAASYDFSAIYTAGRNIAAFNDYQFKSVINSVLKVVPSIVEPFLNGILTDWYKKTTELVKDKASDYIKSVEAIIRNQSAIESNQKAAKEIITKRKEVFSGRVTFTAINETGMLNSMLQRSRMMAIGALSYIWTTQRDERVRPLHQQRHGKMFSWSVPPSDGHPGMPIRCRCIATPVIDFDFEGQFPTDPSKVFELRQYRPGVGQNQRLERNKDYGAAFRSGKLTPGEIISLNRDKSSARSVVNTLLTSGRITQSQLNNLYKEL
jgi:SPP1 gp7 family putative phage head morphogenesis protein